MTRHRFAVRLTEAVVRAGLVLGLAALLIAAAPGPWGDLSDWAGRYPTDRVAKPPRQLLQVPPIRTELHKLLPAAEIARLRSYAVEDPIEVRDGFLIAMQCMPHDCGDNNAMIVIDTRQRRMWVGFFSRATTVVSTQWFGSTDYTALPAFILKGFAAQHEP